MNREQFRNFVLRPALKEIGLWSEAAEALLLGTALVESRLTYLKQFGTGPALGVFQMEPATHDDIWENFLAIRQLTSRQIKGLAGHRWSKHLHPPAEEMIGNLAYAAAMARVHYLRVPKALPDADDIEGMGRYWKQFYNTPLGAGTPEKFVAAWRD